MPTGYFFPDVLLTSNITATKQSVLFSVYLPIKGILYVAAMEKASQKSLTISSEMISKIGKEYSIEATLDNLNSAEQRLVVEDLNPATDYMIYLAAMSDRSSYTSSSWLLRNSFNASTACCRTIYASQTTSVLVSGIDYGKLISWKLDIAPKALMQAALFVFKDTGEKMFSNQLLPSTWSISPTTPVLQFSSS
jgi:hypothetical protein